MSTATMTRSNRRPVRGPETTPTTGRSDEELLGARLAAGDDGVIVELYRAYAGRILGLALHVLHDRQLAEEVVQETILRVWRRAETFDPTRGLEPWLFRIARNAAYDMARARAARPQSQWGDPATTLVSLPDADDGCDPANAVETLTVQWEVRAAIDELPEIEREVVRLQHLCGLSHREVAARLGISVGTVKSRSHRAHGKLAAALSGAGSLGAEAA